MLKVKRVCFEVGEINESVGTKKKGIRQQRHTEVTSKQTGVCFS